MATTTTAVIVIFVSPSMLCIAPFMFILQPTLLLSLVNHYYQTVF